MFFYVQRWITVREVDSRLSEHVLRPLVSDSHLFVASPDEYMIWIFWEMTSGIISICSALGSTVDTCMASVYEVMASFTYFLRERELGSANCAADREDLTGTVLGLVDAAVDVQRQVPWFQTVQNSVEIPQLQFAVAVHRQGLHCLRGFCCNFAAFFALRPSGRECPFFSPR